MKSDIKIIENSSKAQNNSQNNNLSKQVIFNGKNLVNEYASQPNKFITSIMRILFTQEELCNGAIIEDISKTTSKRNPLDLDRVKLLKGIKIHSQL
jgi:hypothetical protein